MQTSFGLLNQLVDGSRVETCARVSLPLISLVDLIETLIDSGSNCSSHVYKLDP
jgi:hypothetical protein